MKKRRKWLIPILRSSEVFRRRNEVSRRILAVVHEIGKFVDVPTFLDKIKDILIEHNYNITTRNIVIKRFMADGFYLE